MKDKDLSKSVQWDVLRNIWDLLFGTSTSADAQTDMLMEMECCIQWVTVKWITHVCIWSESTTRCESMVRWRMESKHCEHFLAETIKNQVCLSLWKSESTIGNGQKYVRVFWAWSFDERTKITIERNSGDWITHNRSIDDGQHSKQCQNMRIEPTRDRRDAIRYDTIGDSNINQQQKNRKCYANALPRDLSPYNSSNRLRCVKGPKKTGFQTPNSSQDHHDRLEGWGNSRNLHSHDRSFVAHGHEDPENVGVI